MRNHAVSVEIFRTLFQTLPVEIFRTLFQAFPVAIVRPLSGMNYARPPTSDRSTYGRMPPFL